MAENFPSVPHEKRIWRTAQQVLESKIEPHPDFLKMSDDEQERIRQWALVLVEAGVELRKDIERVEANDRLGLLENTSHFLEITSNLIPAEVIQ